MPDWNIMIHTWKKNCNHLILINNTLFCIYTPAVDKVIIDVLDAHSVKIFRVWLSLYPQYSDTMVEVTAAPCVSPLKTYWVFKLNNLLVSIESHSYLTIEDQSWWHLSNMAVKITNKYRFRNSKYNTKKIFEGGNYSHNHWLLPMSFKFIIPWMAEKILSSVMSVRDDRGQMMHHCWYQRMQRHLVWKKWAVLENLWCPLQLKLICKHQTECITAQITSIENICSAACWVGLLSVASALIFDCDIFNVLSHYISNCHWCDVQFCQSKRLFIYNSGLQIMFWNHIIRVIIIHICHEFRYGYLTKCISCIGKC